MSPKAVDSSFRRLQLLSAAAYSLGHGANDAQKVMGIIYVALIAAGRLTVHDKIPFWIVISCQCAMALGTLMGGWRIVKTMGTRITYLRPFEGFAAETAGAITLFSTSALGIPVSTTHTITGAIIGAGATKRLSAVRWGVTTNILIAWIITIPITSVLSASIYYILNLIF
jgi:PiT family inorganic phosphate transporter